VGCFGKSELKFCHFVRADEGPIGRVDLAHVFLIFGLPPMKIHIARILSYAVCWIVALTASALAAEKISHEQL